MLVNVVHEAPFITCNCAYFWYVLLSFVQHASKQVCRWASTQIMGPSGSCGGMYLVAICSTSRPVRYSGPFLEVFVTKCLASYHQSDIWPTPIEAVAKLYQRQQSESGRMVPATTAALLIAEAAIIVKLLTRYEGWMGTMGQGYENAGERMIVVYIWAIHTGCVQ